MTELINRFHCDDCRLDFSRSARPTDGPPFTVEGVPGVYQSFARGRVRDGWFVADASACPKCGRLALDAELRAMILEFGWTSPVASLSEPGGILGE